MGDLREGVIADHASGLEFLGAKALDWAATGGKTSFGALLNNPAFIDLEGLSRAIDDLDSVRFEDVFVQGKLVPDYRAIVSDRSDAVYSVVAGRYDYIQDVQVVRPFFEAAQARGLKPVGRIDGIGSGRTVGHVILANPEFRVQLLEGYDDDVLLGLRFWNSYGKETSFGGEVFGVRTVCVNYNLWGRLLGEFRNVHVGLDEATQAAYERLIDRALDASKVLSGVVQTAVEIQVERTDVEDLLWSLNLGPRQVGQIDADLTALEPHTAKDLNAWTLYNAVTAYATYRENGGLYLEATERIARKANDLLSVAHEDLLKKGKARKVAHEEKLAAKGVKPEEAKGEFVVVAEDLKEATK